MPAEQRIGNVRKWGNQTVIERFMSKISRQKGDCWIWLGAKDRNGYGKFTVGRVTMSAHRFSFQYFRGTIPTHLTCDHLCKHTSCVNPLHIELVTMRENLLRGDTFQAKNARKTHCPKGHEFSDENTYNRPDGGRGCRECMRQSSTKWKRKF